MTVPDLAVTDLHGFLVNHISALRQRADMQEANAESEQTLAENASGRAHVFQREANWLRETADILERSL